jgi:DNA modification methylase
MKEINKLILGDNLEILRHLESETVDLIYLDPPFFSNRNYEVIWGDKGEVRSFEDRFSGGIDHYISWLKERVIEMHRILKPTGSIFLHCDWHADAYIRVQILDKIFGVNNYRNSLIWHYKGREKYNEKKVQAKYDTIFFYAKSDKTRINYVKLDWDKEDRLKILRRKIHKEEDGREWFWETRGQANGVEPYKKYLEEYLDKGEALNDVWSDIPMLRGNHPKRIGYPTQKPSLLLHRIIELASKEGDLILDPFIGGGTTVAVADKMERNWIGIDQSVAAVKVTEMRMQNNQTLFSKPFVTQLHKYDYDTLRYKDAFEFEIFIVTQFGGINNIKQRGDLGLDGKTRENQPIQVKRSDNIGRNVIDNFKSACERNDKNLYEKNKVEMKPVGFIIAFSFGKGAVQEVARLHNDENIIIKLVTVEEIIPIAKKPNIAVNIKDKGNDIKAVREIEFVASATSESGIEFFAWDFDYKNNKFNPQILIDKTGTQTHKFKAGLHNIAVKVVDTDGLDNIEIIKLKVNGKIERT